MRRAAWILVLLAAVSAGFGEPAGLAPPGVVRWRLETSYSWANRAFANDGLKESIKGDGASRSISIGAAAELGLSDSLSLAVDWIPAFNLWSELDYPDGATIPNSDATRSGGYDIWAAARIELVGEHGVALASDRLVVIGEPGLIVPLPEPDWQTQNERFRDGKRYIFETPDRRVVGIGARASASVTLDPALRLSAWASYVQLTERKSGSAESPTATIRTDYGYEARLGVEPRFSFDMGRVIPLVGLITEVRASPETLLNDVVDVRASYSLDMEPWLGVSLAARALPLTIKVGYRVPLAGRNVESTNSVLISLESAAGR